VFVKIFKHTANNAGNLICLHKVSCSLCNRIRHFHLKTPDGDNVRSEEADEYKNFILLEIMCLEKTHTLTYV